MTLAPRRTRAFAQKPTIMNHTFTLRALSGPVSGIVLGLIGCGFLSPSPGLAASLPPYRPEAKVTDTLRSWGSNDMGGLLAGWQAGFKKFHPEVRFADKLKGTETAQAALYTEVADLALMDREILTLERHVLLRRKHTYPLAIAVATGSHDAANRAPAIAIFVHKDNPLAQLTMQQIDGIFGEQRTGAWDDQFRWHPELARGPEGNIRTWGQLGLKGEWADKPVQTYGYPVTNYSPLPGPMLFFRKQAFAGADMWNPNLREYPRGGQITAALEQDRYGIAYASLADQTPGIKPLALAAGAGPDFVPLTRDNVASRKYPLSRQVYISVEPGQLADPKVWEFLCYVLSREGQKVVQREGGYLPLTPDEALIQRQKLTDARAAAGSGHSN